MDKKKKITRFLFLYLELFMVIVIISTRLFLLNVAHGAYYVQQSNVKSVETQFQPAPRGKIMDRNGVVFAANKQTYILTYTEDNDSYNNFVNSMEELFKTMDQRKEKLKDDFPLKVEPFRFNFNSADVSTAKAMELKFKKDRGLYEDIILHAYGKDAKWSDLNVNQRHEVEAALMKLTPEQTFNKLWEQYTKNYLNNKKIDLDTKKRIKKYNLSQKRRLMIIRDAVKMEKYHGKNTITLSDNISRETAMIIEQKRNKITGVDIQSRPVRYYPQGELGAPIIGYVSRIGQYNQDKYLEKGYDIDTDYVGAAGMESAYEDKLRGSKGETVIQKDINDRTIMELGSMAAHPGANIYLTIDKNVQYAAERALDSTMETLKNNPDNFDVNTKNATRGAAVAIDVKTGEVLALVSRPSFNPNDFIAPGGLTPELQKRYIYPDMESIGRQYIREKGIRYQYYGLSEQQIMDTIFPVDSVTKKRTDYYDIFPKYMFNYATSSLIPPGSTFKAVTAIAGLQEGVINRYSRINDTGPYNKVIPSYKGACWLWNTAKAGHGYLNVVSALEKSCNYFFYEVGNRLYYKGGFNLLAKYAWQLGLGIDPKSNNKPSTGLEIYENFGQSYNIDSAKRNKSKLFLYSLEDNLIRGTDGYGGRFKGIDIRIKSDDKENVKELKNNIQNNILNVMQWDKHGNEFGKAFDAYSDSLLKDIDTLIKTDDGFKGKKYTKADLGAIKNALWLSIRDAHAEIFTEANVFDAAIGQGINNFTPVQLANYISTIANGGTRYQLHLVKKVVNPDGTQIDMHPVVMNKLQASASTLAAVKTGLENVTEGEDGTAKGVFDMLPFKTAGKTGSASFNINQEKMGRTSYGIFIGYAPADDPKIAVCVVVFDGGHGGLVAPVARAIYEAYFRNELMSKYNYNLPADDSFLQGMFRR